jgi:hypothetical protein
MLQCEGSVGDLIPPAMAFHGVRMKIDWEGKPNAQTLDSTVAILRRTSRGGGGQLESMPKLEMAAAGTESEPGERERLERLKEALAEVKHPAPGHDLAELKDQVMRGARSGMAKLSEGEPGDRFTLADQIGLEAVILTGGERPSLLVKGGFIDLEAADIGEWVGQLGHMQTEIRKVISSVGRINIPQDPGFAGSCFAIAEGIVLTNRHVLEEIADWTEPDAWKLRWPQSTTVDFVGEDDADGATKFRVTGVAFAGPDPINRMLNFAHLDMAILRVDPASDPKPFPKPVTFERDIAQPEGDRDLYVVGFPGRPREWTWDGTPKPGFETAEVISTIFNHKFGVKRLAPGKVQTGAGQVAGDGKGWICTHDASTLAGSSGSCVVDMKSGGNRIVALHFAGLARGQNWAHAAARLRDILADHKANFVV